MVLLIQIIGKKFFSKDGQIELSEREAIKDAGSFILAIMSSILASMFFNETGIIFVGLGVYIFLRYKQRGPFSDF